MLSYHEHNESKRTPELVEALVGGATVVVVTDAGMPSVSDPGYRLVAAAVDAGVRVSAVPGPSAVLTALAVSGLPVDRFCFEGFLPRKAGERSRALAALAGEPRTMVFFEAPHRLAVALAAMAEAFGARPAGGGLPRADQDVRGGRCAGRLAELVDWARGRRGARRDHRRGGRRRAVRRCRWSPWCRACSSSSTTGVRLKEAAGEVAAASGVSKRELYDAVLAARRP